jgi:hypothetical protein
LSEKKGSRFKLTGDIREFTITTRPDIMPFFFWAALVFYVPVSSLISGYIEPLEILTMTLLFIVLVVWYKYSPTTWDITVDTYNKQMVLVCNNPVAGFLKSDIIIPFNEFGQFSAKNIYSQFKGTNNLYTKVFIHHNGLKTPLIYLNREEEDNYKVFISNLIKFFDLHKE